MNVLKSMVESLKPFRNEIENTTTLLLFGQFIKNHNDCPKKTKKSYPLTIFL